MQNSIPLAKNKVLETFYRIGHRLSPGEGREECKRVTPFFGLGEDLGNHKSKQIYRDLSPETYVKMNTTSWHTMVDLKDI